MPKALTISGMIIAGLLLLAFGLDLAIGVPFSYADWRMDAAMVLASLILGYLSWSAMRELR